MHVLVTGANGYLGAVLLHALSHQVSAGSLSALVRQADRFAGDGERRFPAGIGWNDWDEVIAERLDLGGIDIVCHLAAERDAQAPAEIAECLRHSATLFRLAAEHGVKGIVNASTQAVYGTSPPPWTETDPPAPVNAYSASKFAQEVIVENLASIAPSLRTVSLRIAKLVGPAPTMRVAPDEPVHVLARNALAGKDLVLPFEGQQMLDLLDVRDAAAAITHLIGSPVDHWPRVMNLTAGRQVTLLEVAELVCEQLRSHPANPGGQHRIVLQRGKTGSPRNFGMSNALIERTLGWSPRFTLPDTVRDVISALASARS